MNSKYYVWLILLNSQLICAGELNQRTHPAPETQAKAVALIAQAYAQQGVKQDKVVYQNGGNTTNQNVEIGTVHTKGNAPREQNTVINGSVDVICVHCYGK